MKMAKEKRNNEEMKSKKINEIIIEIKMKIMK